MKEVLSYSLGSFPLSISTEQGSLHKTPKSKLLDLIETSTNSESVENVPAGGALILDAMAIVQAITKPPTTFGELADQIFDTVIKTGVYHKCLRVDFVIDTYPEFSIKDIEHSVRASDGATIITIYGAEQKVPTQWKKFLKHGPNKVSLIQFLFQRWCMYRSAKLCGLILYVCVNDQCHCLLPAATSDFPLMTSVKRKWKQQYASYTRQKMNPASTFYVITCSDLESFLILLCHQTKIAFKSISREPITKRQYGSGLHVPALMPQLQSTMVGS